LIGLSRILHSFCVLASLVPCTNQLCCRKAILVIGFEWAILGPRQVCFAPAPAPARDPASAHADTTPPAGPAALAAVPAADSDAAAAAVAAAAYSTVWVTGAFAPSTVLVEVFFITAAIIVGFEWVILGTRQFCFGFGFIIFRPLKLHFR